MSKRSHGDGGIDTRGENVHRLRYRVDGKRFSKTFHGSLGDARKELRRLIRSGDTGEHVDPIKLTVGAWIDQWIAAGAPGRKKERVGQRTLERYEELLSVHVKPVIGNRRLQQLQPQEIDKLYSNMAEAAAIAPRTQHHVHVVLGACLGTATRKGLLVANPMLRVEQIPSVKPVPIETAADADADDDQDDIGEGLTEAELAALISGFKSSSIFPIGCLGSRHRRPPQRDPGVPLDRSRYREKDTADRTRMGTDQKVWTAAEAAQDSARAPDDRFG